MKPSLARPVVLAVLVAVFVALHPYLGSSDLCGPQGCLHAIEAHASASVDPSAAARAALLVPAVALAVAALGRPASERPPGQTYPSPDPRPPRFLPSR